MTKSTDHFQFEGFDDPTFTPVPDVFFDVLIPKLSDAELRVALYIMRRTYGFKKKSDSISLKQMVDGITKRDGEVLDSGSGLSKAGAAKGIRGLVEKGIIVARRNRSQARGDEPTTYRLHFRDDPVSTSWTPPPVHQVDTPLSTPKTPRVHLVDTQDTVEQETVRQETDGDLSKFRKGSRQVLAQGIREQSSDQRPVTDTGTVTASHVASLARRSRSQKASRATSSDQPTSDTATPLADRVVPNSEAPLPSTLTARQPAGFVRLDAVLPASFSPVSSPLSPAIGATATPATEEAGENDDASPEYIENIIRDLSHELSDSAHIRANVTQALHLWQESELSVKAFAEVLYSVRRTTRLQSDVKKPMPYLFKLVRVQLGLAPNPQKNRRPVEQQENDASAPPRSLAGRYAHLVRRGDD